MYINNDAYLISLTKETNKNLALQFYAIWF